MEEIFYIWLSQIKGIGPVLAQELLSYFGDIKKIYNGSKEELMQVPGVGEKLTEKIINNRDLHKAERILKYCMKNEIKIVLRDTSSYPHQLMYFNNAPFILYVKGRLKKFDQGIAVVGSRRCNEYGKNIAIELSNAVSQRGYPIISGMAKGIDGYAHTAAIKNNGYTIAVLGTGIDICYPTEHRSLMNKIIETGAVISQFPPGTTNIKENFIKRNETISMLASKVVILQASKSSGSLHTANFSIKCNKEVYAAPGSLNDSFNEGCNLLISKGANIYLGPQSILHNYSRDIIKAEQIEYELEKQIYDLINSRKCSLDVLKSKLNLSHNLLEEILFKMEIKGIIQNQRGVWCVSSEDSNELKNMGI